MLDPCNLSSYNYALHPLLMTQQAFKGQGACIFLFGVLRSHILLPSLNVQSSPTRLTITDELASANNE